MPQADIYSSNRQGSRTVRKKLVPSIAGMLGFKICQGS